MIIRTVKNNHNPFVMIDKRMLSDNRLSFKAKGILTYLLSKPDDWQVMMLDLCANSKEGPTSIRAGLQELKAAGYARLVSPRGEGGKMQGKYWEVFERPLTAEEITDIKENRTSVIPKLRESNPTNTDKVLRMRGTNTGVVPDGTTGATVSKPTAAVEQGFRLEQEQPPNGKPKPVQPPSDMRRFIGMWCGEYRKRFGEWYEPDGRDCKRLKEMLAETEQPVEALIAVVKRAWGLKDEWLRNQAMVIYGFVDFHNKIKAKLLVESGQDESAKWHYQSELTRKMSAAELAGNTEERRRLEKELEATG